MPQEHTPAEIKAEASSEETKQFVRRVRRVTRRKFSPEAKVRVVLEGFRGEVKVSELCRREGIRPNVYYAWLKDFMEAGKELTDSYRRALYTLAYWSETLDGWLPVSLNPEN